MNKNYLDFFTLSLQENLAEMAELSCGISSPTPQPLTFNSSGLAVIIGITGQRPGRILIDSDLGTAQKLSQLLNEEEEVEHEVVLETMAELANILSGHTITHVKNANKGMNLMLTPPSIFCGEGMQITSPKINAEVISVTTPVGGLVVSVGFEGGQ